MTLDLASLGTIPEDGLAENAWNAAQRAAMEEHREQVRLRCVAEYSSSHLWQQRAAKDPEYWNRFYVGRHNL